MFGRPTTLSTGRAREVETHLDELRVRLQRHVSAILAEVESETIRDQLRLVAFSPNELLPKRQYRPTIKIEHLAEQLYLAFDPDGARTEPLLQFALAVQEYYDIADDLIDGDVAEGAETEVIVTNELLLPVVLRTLDRLGDDAVSYWSNHASRMVGWFVDELLSEPSKEAYLDVVDKEAELYGAVTGLAAVAAAAGDDRVQRAEEIGSAFFKHEQFLLDLQQYDEGDPDPWNAWRLFPEEEAAERVRAWQRDVVKRCDDLPEERAALVRPMVAVDVDACKEQFL